MTSAWAVNSTTGGLNAQSVAGSTRLQPSQTMMTGSARPNDARWLSTQVIVERRPQMVQCVEDGSLNKVATETFRSIDREGVGQLTWNSGAIRDFITQVLARFELPAPPENQVYQLYLAFDRDKSGSLSLSECLRLVEAIVRAAFSIKFEARGSGPRLSATMGAPRPSAPPLAQLATQTLPVPSGAPVVPPASTGRGIRLAQEWISSYQVPLLSHTRIAYTPGAQPVDITNFAGSFTQTANANASHLPRMKSALENLSLLKAALDIFQSCDRDRKGYLTWEHGEVYVFISKVFEQQGLVPPGQDQIKGLFRGFDSNQNGCLEPREGLHLVDALARSIILAQSPQAQPRSPNKSSAYSLAEEWLSSFRPPTVGMEVSYGEEPVNLYLLANHIKPVLSQNAQHRQRMIMAIESGELLKEAMRLFKECDRDRNGKLTWNQGEIRSFISQVLQHYNLIVPSEEQLYLIYRHFDKDTSYSLDVRESLCLADAVVRSMFLDVSPAHSAVSRSSVRSLRFSEMGSPPLRRPAMNHDEELARRVANQESAMEKKLERLIRACNDAVSLRLMVSLMHVTFSAWRQCATKNLFAKEKEGWDLQCARKRLQEEQQNFEDELERLEQRRILDTTTSLSQREATELKAEAEEEAERKHAKERQLWESRIKEERLARERLERNHKEALLLAEAQAEERAENRFVQERLIYEERLREERERRNRAETAKAQAFDRWAEDARRQKRNAVQQVMASWLPKNTQEQAARLLRAVAGKWLELSQAGGRRRRRLTAIDKAVMSWGRKSMSGRPGPSFHAWKDICRARKRAKAAVGVLSRQWLGGSKGLMAPYLAAWRDFVAQKRKAKRRAKAHAQIDLLLQQWERGQKAGLLSSYSQAWRAVAKEGARRRRIGRRREAVQLALMKWARGATKGLLQEVLRLWHKQYVGRKRQAYLMSSYLVKWEMEAEVGLLHTCHVAWKKLADASVRKRMREHGKENVKLALEKFLRGNARGLAHEVLEQWFKISVLRRQRVDMVKKSLVAWEQETGVGIVKTCTAAWKRLVDARANDRLRQNGKEAVKLALQKWERGDTNGLLHEVVSQWHKVAVIRGRRVRMMSNFLVSWEVEAEVGLLQTCHVAWRRLAEAGGRQRGKEQGREAVQLALQKWERGNIQGLLHEVLSRWHDLTAKGHQKAKLLGRCLVAWESKAGVGIQATFLAAWRHATAEASKKHAKQRTREAVQLALQKWERGNVSGLLHECLDQWHRLSAKHKQKERLIQRGLLAWESKTGVGLQATFWKLWKDLAAAKIKERNKKRSEEAVHLAVQKFIRGNQRGLLAESVSEWKKLVQKDKAKTGVELMIQRWVRGDAAGLMAEVLAVWKKLLDNRKAAARRERAHQAVNLLLCTWRRPGPQGVAACALSAWNRYAARNQGRTRARNSIERQVKRYLLGKTNAMRGVVLADWRQVTRRGKAHGSVEIILKQWELGSARGLQTTVMGEWQRFVKELKRDQKHQRAHAAVEVALAQWEKGESKGLMATVVKDWRKYTEVTTSNGRRIRGAGTLEEKLLLSLLQLCLHGWRKILEVERAMERSKALRESLRQQREEREQTENNLLLNLAMAVWQLCVMEPKKDQAFQQLTETNAIAFQLQEACQVYSQENETLQERLKQVMETLQRELQTKEELAKELRDAYSKQARLSPMLPELPEGIVQNRGAASHAQALEDVAASVASGKKKSKASPRGTPRRSNGIGHCDWDTAVPRMEEMMKSFDDDKAPKDDFMERFEELAREELLEPVTRSPDRSDRSSTPTSAAAARRRRLAAERAGQLEDDRW